MEIAFRTKMSSTDWLLPELQTAKLKGETVMYKTSSRKLQRFSTDK